MHHYVPHPQGTTVHYKHTWPHVSEDISLLSYFQTIHSNKSQSQYNCDNINNITSPEEENTIPLHPLPVCHQSPAGHRISVITSNTTTTVTRGAAGCEYTFLHKSSHTMDQPGQHRWYSNQAIGWTTMDHCSIPSRDKIWSFFFLTTPRVALWSGGIKQPRFEADHSPIYIAHVKNEHSYTSTPL